jgi:uncharacterized protein
MDTPAIGMEKLLSFLFVLTVGLVAGTISGIVGTGSSIMLTPVLVYEYGPKQAVPIMAIAAVMTLRAHPRLVARGRLARQFCLFDHRRSGCGIGRTHPARAAPTAVDVAIGVFLVAMVPVRHFLARHQLKANLWHLAIGGAIIGFLTGIVVSTGPLSVPLFLFYGLTKGAFLATEAASSLGLYLSKSMTFERLGALTPDVALNGLVAGLSLMFGAFIAKRFVLKLEPDIFRLAMASHGRDHDRRRHFHAVDRRDLVKFSPEEFERPNSIRSQLSARAGRLRAILDWANRSCLPFEVGLVGDDAGLGS